MKRTKIDGVGKAVKQVKEAEKVTPELEAVLNAIDNYIKVNNGNVCVFADFIAFDEDKEKLKLEDITKDGSDRVIAFGHKNCLRIALDEMRNFIEDDADEDGFVNL